MPTDAQPTDLFVLARPFILMAAVAFMAGFLGYVEFARPSVAATPQSFAPTTVSAPGADAWNLPQPV